MERSQLRFSRITRDFYIPRDHGFKSHNIEIRRVEGGWRAALVPYGRAFMAFYDPACERRTRAEAFLAVLERVKEAKGVFLPS